MKLNKIDEAHTTGELQAMLGSDLGFDPDLGSNELEQMYRQMQSTGEFQPAPTAMPDGEIHPDIIYDKGKAICAFIYTSNHKLHLSRYPFSTHTGMLKGLTPTHSNPMGYNMEIIQDLGWTERGVQLYDKVVKGRDAIINSALAGRVGYPDRTDRSQLIAAIWPSPLTDELLAPCLQALLQARQIQPNTPVYSTHTEGESVQEVLGGQSQLDPERERKLRLAHQVHLLRGDEKKAAMKELGLGGGDAQHPIAAALEKHKLLGPGQKWWAPHSEARDPELIKQLWWQQQEKRIAAIQKAKQQEQLAQATRQPRTDYYINPDNVMVHTPGETQTTFVFTPPDKLFFQHGRGTHSKLIKDDPKLRFALRITVKIANQIERIPPWMLAFGLFGRIGTSAEVKQQLVSFWNSPQEVYDELIEPCLDTLINQHFISPNAYVHYPTQFNIQISKLFAGEVGDEVEDKQAAMHQAELARQMHLARGDEKKAIMKQLGVGGGGGQHPVAAALEKHKLLKPGEKWWAPHSEGKEC